MRNSAPDGSFPEVIARALHDDFGGTPASVKVVARMTGANERAVKNWFDGKNGPSGANLVVLMRHSDRVLESVLDLAGRHELNRTKKLSVARDALKKMIVMIDAMEAEIE